MAQSSAAVARCIVLILLLLYYGEGFWQGELDSFPLKCADGILHRFAAGVLRKSILWPAGPGQGVVTPKYSPGWAPAAILER